MGKGILDSLLSKHLQAVKSYFTKNTAPISATVHHLQNVDNNYDPVLGKKIQDENSVTFRNHGNAAFKKGEYQQARVLYTQSVAAAKDGAGPASAMAYANRSAAFFYMNLYEDCLKDIERALSLEYPDNLKYKIYARKVRCLKYLGRSYSDIKTKVCEVIDEHNKHEDVKFKENILKEMELDEPSDFKMMNPDNEIPQPHKWKKPSLKYGINSEMPCFSSAVSVAYDKELGGKIIVASRKIEIGDVLVMDESLSSALASEVQWDFCSKCYFPCYSLVPCKTCGFVMYCSEICREEDLNLNHRDSCYYTSACYNTDKIQTNFNADEVYFPQEHISTAHFTCNTQRLISTFGMQNIIDVALENKPINSNLKSNTNGEKYDPKSLESILSMEDDLNGMDRATRDAFSKLALITAGYRGVPISDIVPVAAIILKLYLVFKENQKPVYLMKTNYKTIGLPRVVIGYSMHTASRYIKHACDANMYQVNYGSTFVFRAKRPINKGEKLTDCFLVAAMNVPYKERQEFFKRSAMKCSCDACNTKLPISAKLPNINIDDESMGMIMSAGFELPDMNELTKLLYYMDYGIPADMDMLPKMVNLINIMYKKNKKRNQWYYKLQESIKNHYRARGNCLFFNNSKQIMEGTEVFDASAAMKKLPGKLESLVSVPGLAGSFGLKVQI